MSDQSPNTPPPAPKRSGDGSPPPAPARKQVSSGEGIESTQSEVAPVRDNDVVAPPAASPVPDAPVIRSEDTDVDDAVFPGPPDVDGSTADDLPGDRVGEDDDVFGGSSGGGDRFDDSFDDGFGDERFMSRRQPDRIPTNVSGTMIVVGAKAGGVGKLLPLDTPIPVPVSPKYPDGWATMGDLEVGDTVFDRFGKPCDVTWLSDIDPNPKMFDLHFSDGQVVTACADHLWTVSRSANADVEMVLTTNQMLGEPGWMIRRIPGLVQSDSVSMDGDGSVFDAVSALVESGVSMPVWVTRGDADTKAKALEMLKDAVGGTPVVADSGWTASVDERVGREIAGLARSAGLHAEYGSGYVTVAETRSEWHYVVDIVPAESRPGRCIRVSSPDATFLCHDFIPTHNSSTAAHIAEMAAEQGFRTICIDEKSQGDLRKRLGFDDSRTLWQIARYWDGSPDSIHEWIVQSPDTKTDWIVGPDSAPDDYDDDLIPDEMLGRLVDVLLDQYEIVVVDTHPAKKQATSIYYTQWIPRLVQDPRHAAVVVSEWDRAKLNSAVDWVTGLVAARVDPSRTFFLGMLPQGGAMGALSYENVARRFTMVRTLEPIPFSQAVKDANNGLGDSPMGGFRDREYRAAIRAALFDILGDPRFEPEEEPKKWWQKLFGGDR